MFIGHTQDEAVPAAKLLSAGRDVMAAPALFVLLTTLTAGADAQQREPAVEVFALGGAYLHGNVPMTPPPSGQWRPQAGGGVLAPLGRNWAALFDVTASALEAHWLWNGGLPGGPGDNFTRVRRITMFPSIVRLWRRDWFAVYAGAGPGFEHNRERSRFRPIVARDEQGRPVLAEKFESTPTTRVAPLGLRAGIIVSPGARLVVRACYSYLRRYSDASPSRGVEAGVGYRFR